MEEKISNMDKKILLELDKDSRQPYSKLAKRLGTSQQVINYRIKRLLDIGVITEFVTSFSTVSLGLPIITKFYIQLTGTDEKTEKKLQEYLLKHKDVNWVAQTLGEYDLFTAVMVKDLETLGDFKEDLFTHFGKYINEYEIAFIHHAVTLPRTYINEKSKEYLKQAKIHESVKIDLSKKDKKIIKEIANNSRISVLDLAKSNGVDVRTVIKRLRFFEDKRLIQGFRININRQKLGVRYYKVFIKLRSYGGEGMKQLEEYCNSKKGVLHFIENIGKYEYELEMEVPSPEEMQKFIKELRNEYSKTIDHIKTVEIIDELKLSWIPNGFD
ncbi:MAG: Lrp/AsnC family transcriptional regulator [archaeon]